MIGEVEERECLKYGGKESRKEFYEGTALVKLEHVLQLDVSGVRITF